MGRARSGATEEDWCWDLNPGAAAIWHLFLGLHVLLGTTCHWASFQGLCGIGHLFGDHGPWASCWKNHAALAEWGPHGFDESQDHAALGCSLLPHGLGSRRDFAWKKRGDRTVAGGP